MQSQHYKKAWMLLIFANAWTIISILNLGNSIFQVEKCSSTNVPSSEKFEEKALNTPQMKSNKPSQLSFETSLSLQIQTKRAVMPTPSSFQNPVNRNVDSISLSGLSTPISAENKEKMALESPTLSFNSFDAADKEKASV